MNDATAINALMYYAAGLERDIERLNDDLRIADDLLTREESKYAQADAFNAEAITEVNNLRRTVEAQEATIQQLIRDCASLEDDLKLATAVEYGSCVYCGAEGCNELDCYDEPLKPFECGSDCACTHGNCCDGGW